MQMFYSASTGGFYADEIHGDSRPGDCVAIDAELYASLQGREVVAGPGGFPEASPSESIAAMILRAKADTRVQRQPIIEILDGLQSSALTKGELSRAQVIESAKQGLRDITSVDLTACTTYDEMRLKVKAAYVALATALPADLRQAFKEALS